MNSLFLKIFFIIQKLKSSKFFETNDYDSIIKLLCTKKKIKFLRVFVNDLFLFLKEENLYNFNFCINNKTLKILFISLFTHKDKFYNIIFNNKTEYNNELKLLSLETITLIKNFNNYKYKKIKLIKIAKNFEKYYNLYKKWEIVDKRINTQKLLIDYLEIKLSIDLLDSSISNYDIIRESYLKELKNIELNVKYMKDSREINYFNQRKDNYDNYQKMQEELYWQKIKYEISCEDKFKDTILKLVDKTKKMFIDCIPNNLQKQNEIHENLDLEILGNMLTRDLDNSLDFVYLEGKLYYILDVLKQFQSPNSDESYEKWCNEIGLKLQKSVFYKDLIPFFFRNLFDRLIIILEEIQKFKENIII